MLRALPPPVAGQCNGFLLPEFARSTRARPRVLYCNNKIALIIQSFVVRFLRCDENSASLNSRTMTHETRSRT